MNVFSKYLKWFWKNQNLKSVIEQMQAVYKTDEFHAYYCIEINPHVLIDSPLTTNEYNQEGTYVYECFNNKHLKNVIKWINKNIVLQINKDNYLTTLIKIRIAGCMMNRLVYKGVLSKEFNIKAHDILVANVVDLKSKLLDEDLPF